MQFLERQINFSNCQSVSIDKIRKYIHRNPRKMKQKLKEHSVLNLFPINYLRPRGQTRGHVKE